MPFPMVKNRIALCGRPTWPGRLKQNKTQAPELCPDSGLLRKKRW